MAITKENNYDMIWPLSSFSWKSSRKWQEMEVRQELIKQPWAREQRRFHEKLQFFWLENEEKVAHCRLRTNRKRVHLVINEPQTHHNKTGYAGRQLPITAFYRKSAFNGAMVQFMAVLLSHACPQEIPGDNALTILHPLMPWIKSLPTQKPIWIIEDTLKCP